MNKDIIAWWSGGITSAVACHVAISIYGRGRCRVIMIDTENEHEDTYRFKKDCEKWYGIEIETISAMPTKYKNIQDVWETHTSLNVAKGAICSYKLKRVVREDWERDNVYSHQIFGFEFDKKEFNRALSLTMNHPNAKPIYPLLMMGYDKEKCIEIVLEMGIDIPKAYLLGFSNNNCLKTGCVQGGIGYWQKMKRDFPEKFTVMARVEHDLTNKKGKPVTMLKDQSKDAKESGNILVFLIKHPDYPNLKCISDMKAREPRPLVDCNGFCGVNELNNKNITEKEINWEDEND